MSLIRFSSLLATCILSLTSASAMAQEAFTLTSPSLVDGAPLPDDLKCTRNGGDGVSPPIAWSNPPAGTAGYAVIMHHYRKGRAEGKDTPSQYWLLWNIPADTTEIERGNPTSIGDEGANKDERGAGYTPPCAPAGPPPPHRYTITVYALSAPLSSLPDHDDGDVDWAQMTEAMEGLVLADAAIGFTN